MISFDLGLSHRVERYLLGRDVSADYATMLRNRVAAFCDFCKCDIREDAVTAELVNEWLNALLASGLSPYTVDGYRRAVLAVINDEEGTCGTRLPFLRLKRIRKPRRVIQAYTHDEIVALVTAASLLVGRFPDGRRRDDYWAGIIESAYSTCLRRGDLLGFDMEMLLPDGSATVVQHKTGVPVTISFPRPVVARMKRLQSRHPFAWPFHRSHLVTMFNRIRKRAGVTRGSFKWLRRAGSSHAERHRPGTGHQVLGQTTDKCFRASYEDRSITRAEIVTPPPLPK